MPFSPREREDHHTSFNPRPAVRPGDATESGVTGESLLVSIRARP